MPRPTILTRPAPADPYRQSWSYPGDGFCLFNATAGPDFCVASLRKLELFAWEILHVEVMTADVSAVPALTPVQWLGAEAHIVNQPTVLMAAFNLNPRPPSKMWMQIAPGIRDRAITKVIEDRYRLGHPFLPLLKVTANPREAWNCVHRLWPQHSDLIARRITELKDRYRTPEPVVQRLSRVSRRTKVELIRYGEQLAVRKTWRPSQHQCWARELRARTALSNNAAIPPILASGEHWIITPYYDDVLRWTPHRIGLLPLRYARQIFQSLREIHDAGYYLLDFLPWNVIVDRKEGVKFVDLEFLYTYEPVHASLQGTFERSFSLAGTPDGFSNDMPIGPMKPYTEVWKRCVGLSLQSLINDPVVVQHAKRFLARLGLPFRALPVTHKQAASFLN